MGRDGITLPALIAVYRLAMSARGSLSVASAVNRLCHEDLGEVRVAAFQRSAPRREALLHRRVILRQIAHLAAILER